MKHVLPIWKELEYNGGSIAQSPDTGVGTVNPSTATC